MKTLAIIYITFIVINTLITPFLFGKSRGEYNAKNWIISMIGSIPLLYLLIKIL